MNGSCEFKMEREVVIFGTPNNEIEMHAAKISWWLMQLLSMATLQSKYAELWHKSNADSGDARIGTSNGSFTAKSYKD